jgi:hypothetical protein
MQITIPNGSGGFMSQDLPGAGNPFFDSVYSEGTGHWAALLTYLVAIFGETACKGQGVADAPVSGTGNGTWGVV